MRAICSSKGIHGTGACEVGNVGRIRKAGAPSAESPADAVPLHAAVTAKAAALTRTAALMLAAVLALATASLALSAVAPREALATTSSAFSLHTDTTHTSGSCGDDATYVFDTSTGTLTISGTGTVEAAGADTFTSYWENYYFEDEVIYVVIEEGIEGIGDCAFYDCQNLVQVVIPDTVTTIGDRAFGNCYSLESIEFSENVTSIGENSFRNCTSLTEITIPATLGSVPTCAFYGCAGLVELTIEDGIESIEHSAFRECVGLTTVSIPDSVTYIGTYAFGYCDGLVSVTVGTGLSDEDSCEAAFAYCTNLETIVLGCPTVGGYMFAGCTSLTDVTFLDTVVAIEEYAFSGCSSLVSIEIPDSVTSIGSSAFRRCTSLVSVDLGEGVTTVGSYVFYDCTSLEYIVIGESVTSFGSYVFKNCDSLSYFYYGGTEDEWESLSATKYSSISGYEVVYTSGGLSGTCGDGLTWSISAGVLTISGTGAMDDYSYYTDQPWYDYRGSIKKVEVLDGVTHVGEVAFSYLVNLTEATIAGSVEDIGYGAFEFCTSLSTVTLEDGVETVGDYAFADCYTISSLALPGSVESIGEYAFYVCSSLRWIVLPDGLESIGEYAFSGCTSLISVVIPSSMTCIEAGTFEDCEALVAVVLYEGLSTVLEDAFSGCSALSDVYFTCSSSEFSMTVSSGNDCFNQATVHFDCYFSPYRDTNQYPHSGFASYATSYLQLLLDMNSGLTEYSEIMQRYNSTWSGSCLGVTLSMVFASEGELTTILGSSNYWDLGPVLKNDTLMDVVNYYTLCQYSYNFDYDAITYSAGGEHGAIWDWLVNVSTSNDQGNATLKEFLTELVAEAQRSEEEQVPFVLGYTESDGGHAVVVCGYEQESDGTHVIKIYDPNSYSLGAEYYEFTVAKNYGSFSYTDANGSVTGEALEDEWTSLKYFGIDTLADADWNVLADGNLSTASDDTGDDDDESASSASSVLSAMAAAFGLGTASTTSTVSASATTTSTTTITFSAFEEFELVNEEGQTLSFDGEVFDGDMTVYTIKEVGESDLKFYLTVDVSDSFTVTGFGDDFNITAEIDGVYYTATASGADSITLSRSDGVELSGSDYTFTAGASVELEAASLVCFSGTAAGDVSVNVISGGIAIDTNGNCDEVTVDTYLDSDYESTTIEVEGERTAVTDTEGGDGVEIETGIDAIDIVELAGSNRYGTMQAIVTAAFSESGSEYAVVATGANFPDALSAAALAGVLDAPVILVNDKTASTAVELMEELGVETAYVVGGTSAVSKSTVSKISAAGIATERVYGANRYKTALAIADAVVEISGDDVSSTCIVASGTNFPDALSGSPYSYWSGSPIYLAGKNGTLDASTLAAIEEAGYSQIVVLGGESAVSASSFKKLEATGAEVVRLGGTNRYETSVLVAEWSVEQGMSYDNAAIATGAEFPDALAGAALCGSEGSVLLLAAPTLEKSESMLSVIETNIEEVSKVYVLGGTGAVSQEIRDAIEAIW